MPQSFNTGDLVATPLPSINVPVAKSNSTAASVQFGSHNTGFVWVAPPTGTKAGMTLCVTLRVKYDQDLRRRVEAYQKFAQGGAGSSADKPSFRASALPASQPGSISASVTDKQNSSASEEEQSSSEYDSSDGENENENQEGSAAAQRHLVVTNQSAASSSTGIVKAAASRTSSASDGVAAFTSSYLRAANMSELVNMRASFRNGSGRRTKMQRQRQQQDQRSELLGASQTRHASGSLKGGFAPSEWGRK